jgi:hypothetical protein
MSNTGGAGTPNRSSQLSVHATVSQSPTRIRLDNVDDSGESSDDVDALTQFWVSRLKDTALAPPAAVYYAHVRCWCLVCASSHVCVVLGARRF